MLHTPVRAWMQEHSLFRGLWWHDALCQHEFSVFPSYMAKDKLKLEECVGSKMERKVETLLSAWLQLWRGQRPWPHPRILAGLAHIEHFDRLVLMWGRLDLEEGNAVPGLTHTD